MTGPEVSIPSHEHSNGRNSSILGVAAYFAQKIKPIIDSSTNEPSEELNLPNEAKSFCELEHVMSSNALPREAKIKLIAVPHYANIVNFLYTYLDQAHEAASKQLIHSFVLVERLLENTKWQLRSTNWRIFLIISLKLAQKWQNRGFLSANKLHELYPLYSVEEYALLESRFVELLQFRCHVEQAEIDAACRRLGI